MTDLQKIKKILKKYSVKEAYIFGSYLENPKKAHDIDLAVSLKNKGLFFKLYSVLDDHFEKPLEMIYLGGKDKFNQLIRRDGLKIYG